MTQELGSSLGNSVFDARKTLKMSLRALAVASDVSTAYISRIERGEAYPSAIVASKIFEALGVKRRDDYVASRVGNVRVISPRENGALYLDDFVLCLELNATPNSDNPYGLISIESYHIINPLPISQVIKFNPTWDPENNRQSLEPIVIGAQDGIETNVEKQKGVQARGCEYRYPRLPFNRDALVMVRHAVP